MCSYFFLTSAATVTLTAVSGDVTGGISSTATNRSPSSFFLLRCLNVGSLQSSESYTAPLLERRCFFAPTLRIRRSNLRATRPRNFETFHFPIRLCLMSRMSASAPVSRTAIRVNVSAAWRNDRLVLRFFVGHPRRKPLSCLPFG